MSQELVTRLEAYFHRETNDELRSIVTYGREGFDLVYLRDDVADEYTEAELEQAVDDARLESLTAPVYEETFAGDHGDLTCLVKWFETVVELNFVLDDGIGAAVGLDADALESSGSLVAEAREIAVGEREEDVH